ncbi:MAG: 30S ribosomal protein S6 [Acidobacteria bacterium]|nr:30S ribosomal protein S6 [Acidobacteriota bacterium]
MRVYEVMFIVAPNTEADVIDSLVTQLSDVATHQGARVTNVHRMGLRRLAYPIQKFNEAHYIVLTIEGSGAEIAEIERRMRVVDAIIRYLTIRIDEDLKRADKLKKQRVARAAASGGHARSRRGASSGGNAPYVESNDDEEDE